MLICALNLSRQTRRSTQQSAPLPRAKPRGLRRLRVLSASALSFSSSFTSSISLTYLNSFIVISFADPHPLTLLESYRFKNIGGGGCSFSKLSTFNCRLSTSDHQVGRAPSFRRIVTSLPHHVFTSLFHNLKGFPCPPNITPNLTVSTRILAASVATC